MSDVWLLACPRYDPGEIAEALRPAVDRALGSSRGPACVVVDAPFVDPRFAPMACIAPPLVQGLVRSLGATETIVAARSLPGFPTRYTLAQAGYGRLQGVRLLSLDESPVRSIVSPSGGTVTLPAAYLDAAVRVLVARLKAGVYPRLSLSAAVLLSLLPDHGRGDPARLDAWIVELTRAAAPHLVVIDAIEAGHDGNELTCRPLSLGALIAGTDPYAVDLTAAAVVGVSPDDLVYLPDDQRLSRPTLGDVTLDDLRRRTAGFVLPPQEPEVLPLPQRVRVVRGEGAPLSGSAGTLTVALQVMPRAGGWEEARETTIVVGRTREEQVATSEQHVLTFVGDDAAAPYRGFHRVARIRGRPVMLRTLLNDLPFIMRTRKPLDDHILGMTLAALRSQVARRRAGRRLTIGR